MNSSVHKSLFYALVFCSFASTECFSQVTGPTTATVGQVSFFYYDDGTNYNGYEWSPSDNDGMIISQGQTSGTTQFYAMVNWKYPGTFVLTFVGYGSPKGSITVTVSCPSTVSPPSTTFSYSNTTTTCSTTVISYNTTPPYGTWYWQTTPTGTSLDNSSNSFIAALSGTYYLRAYCGGTWSDPLATSPITVITPPSISVNYASNICSKNSSAITVTGTSNASISWAVVQTGGVSGGFNDNGSLGASSYTINQSLVNSSNVNGTAQYAISSSENGCSGNTVVVTLTVQPLPAASASGPAVFSGSTTNVTIIDPSGVNGTTFSWTETQNNVSGAQVGNGALISQQLLSTSTTIGTVVYTITPTASGCPGPLATDTVRVYPPPTITAPQNYVGLGISVTLSTGSYDSYAWSNKAGMVVGTGQTFTTNLPDTYSVAVTKSGVIGSGIGTFVVGGQFSGQDASYIATNFPQVSGVTTSTQVDNLNGQQLIQSVDYFDGLGRPEQKVVTQGSPLMADIVTPVVFDAFGRENKKYLPVAVESNGRFKTNLLDANGNYAGEAQNFYNNGPSDKIADDANPYAAIILESSPLNRVLKQGAAGATWQPDANPNSITDHTVKHHYELNGSTDAYLFKYDPSTGLVSLDPSTFYAVNQLHANRTTDEHQNDVIEYVDKLGHTVCKKVQYSTDGSGNKLFASTYYVYDDLGNLVVVLPPEAVKALAPQQ